jgi:hypothetical protein
MPEKKYYRGSINAIYGVGYQPLAIDFRSEEFSQAVAKPGTSECRLKPGANVLVETSHTKDTYNRQLIHVEDTSGDFKLFGVGCLWCTSVNSCQAVLSESKETKSFVESLRPEENFYERLQRELNEPIMYRRAIVNRLSRYVGISSDDNIFTVPSDIAISRVYIENNGECTGVTQMSHIQGDPFIQLIGNYDTVNGSAIHMNLAIRTPKSATSTGLFFSHDVSKDRMKNELRIGLEEEGEKRIFALLRSENCTIPDGLNSMSGRWFLSLEDGIWYIKHNYVSEDFSYVISNVSLAKLEIDNVPLTAKLGDPAVTPILIKARINRRKIEIAIPPNKGQSDSGLRDRIISGQSMIPMLIKVDGEEKNWEKN